MPDPRSRTAPAHRAALAVMATLVALAALVGCTTVGSDPSPSAAPSPTTVAPTGTTVAAAKGSQLEVFATKPSPDGPVPAPEPPAGEGSRLAIPRAGLNTAGVRVTDTGWVFDNPTYYGSPLVTVVTGPDGGSEQEGSAGEGEGWLQVMVPARPNGQVGWVRSADVTLSHHDFHGQLDLAQRRLRFWDGDQVLADTEVVVGKDVSPTPQGRFFVNEILDTSEIGVSTDTYGPWLLSTSAYSEALDLFDGGLPVIALHGTGHPELIGTAASNGCVRMPNDVVTLLASTLPAGTPIDIGP